MVLNKFALAAYKILRSHPRLKSLVMAVLHKTGLFSLAASRISYAAINVPRAAVAARHLRGCGLEIGAMHQPLPVHPSVSVRYVDLLSKPEALRRFPNLESVSLGDARHHRGWIYLEQRCGTIPGFPRCEPRAGTFAEPAPSLAKLDSVLRPGGVLFVTVPVAEKCFDRGRLETPIEHMVEDYRLCHESQLGEFRERNRPHYEEWVRISLPNIALEEKREPPLRSPREIA